MALQSRNYGNSQVDASGEGDLDRDALKDPDTQVIDEAKHRFKRAMEWEGDMRALFTEDVKFANGDADNGWQWPDNIKKDRDLRDRPCLTINKVKMHVLMLANEARQNPPSARVKPVGDKVSYAAAEVWEGLVRHIEYVSDAQSVYTNAKQDQLEGGIGYWHIQPDYEDDRSFDQELRIGPLEAMKVLLDCDIKRTDGSDAMWGFLFDDYDRREFKKLFPRVALPSVSSASMITNQDDWIRRESVRVAQYYRIQLSEEELIYIEDDSGNSWTGLRKDIPSSLHDDLPLYECGDIGGDYKSRKVMNRTLQWFKIGGDEILDRRDGSSRKCPNLKGRYIPIVRMPGRERTIQDKLYRAGLVRGLKDAQRMYNYNTSGEVEVVALQTKTPWIVAAEAIEGNEAAWENANTTNAAYLTFKAIADDGETQLPKPERMQAPQPAQGFLEGLRIAAAEMEMASGQYSGQMQAEKQTLERSPRAIDQRSRMGELANYDFTYNEMRAIRHTAVILIDLLPEYYDTERVVKIRAQDNEISEININPNMSESYQKSMSPDGQTTRVLFNPKIGKYAVEADIGPTYQTQREEAWNAGKEVIAGAPELMNVIGDLVFLAADWPMADKIAERIKRHIAANSPWLLDDQSGQGAGPAFAKLNEQLQATQGQLSEAMEKLAEARIKMKGRDELRDIESFNADTRRLAEEIRAMKELMLTPAARAQMEHDIAMRGREHVYSMIEGANEAAVGGGSPQSEGAGGNGKAQSQPVTVPADHPILKTARRARDGRHYIPDAKRPGKYLMVA